MRIFDATLSTLERSLDVRLARQAVLNGNVANAETTRGPDGKPYQRLDPVLEAVPFETSLGEAQPELMGVRVAEIVKDATPGPKKP